MPKLADRVKESTTSVGTGAISMGGAAAGYRTFAASFTTGDTVYYCIEGGAEWEVGIGTLTTGTPWTMARTNVTASSNAGSLVNFSAGTKNVFCSGISDALNPYISEASNFDGTTSYFGKNAALTGIADSKEGTISMWIRRDADSVLSRIFSSNVSGIAFQAQLQADNTVRILGTNSTPSTVLTLISISAIPAGDIWHHVIASWNLNVGAAHLYIDDVSSLAASPTLTNDFIDYTPATPNWGIGATGAGGDKFTGAMSDFYFSTTYIDISQLNNRRKFLTSGVNPVFLGRSGKNPTGSIPVIYLAGKTTDFHKNRGSGGVFTANGTILSEVDSPSFR